MSETIYLSTRELHTLLLPVLPHASTDKTLPDLGVIRLEVRDNTLYAVATDRYTMAATRHRLEEPTPDTDIAIGSVDAAALLKVFKYSRSDNPGLQLAVGTVEDETVLDPADRPALTVSAKGGSALVMHGRESKTLANWRKYMTKVIHREQKPASPHLVFTAAYLARWSKAAINGSHLSLHAGAEAAGMILVRAGDHFIGIWAQRRTDGETRLADSPWLKELPPEVEPSEAAQVEAEDAA